MLPDIIVIVAVTSFIQSIFGVGVLLFGTPLLLLRGYDFIHTLMILLPISIIISIIQIARGYKYADLDFYKKILLYTIPFVIFFLFIVTKVKINVGFIVGMFLLFVAVKEYMPKINTLIMYFLRYETIYLIVMGIIHGLTNLGGSLLTAIVHGKQYEKQMTRTTVALSYATFATFQILTLLISGNRISIKFPGIGMYVFISVLVFIFTEKLVYMKINTNKYSKLFAVLLFMSGVILCVKFF